jgi:hypothetical protein
MKTEQLELINKVQRLAEDLVKDVYSSPFDTDSAYSLVNEINEVIEELQEFNDVEGFLELEEND